MFGPEMQNDDPAKCGYTFPICGYSKLAAAENHRTKFKSYFFLAPPLLHTQRIK